MTSVYRQRTMCGRMDSEFALLRANMGARAERHVRSRSRTQSLSTPSGRHSCHEARSLVATKAHRPHSVVMHAHFQLLVHSRQDNVFLLVPPPPCEGSLKLSAPRVRYHGVTTVALRSATTVLPRLHSSPLPRCYHGCTRCRGMEGTSCAVRRRARSLAHDLLVPPETRPVRRRHTLRPKESSKAHVHACAAPRGSRA